MNNKHYHIDVTPEEELMFNTKKTPNNSDIKIKEPRAFMVTGAVIIIHVICAACVLGFSSSIAAQKPDENKNKSEEIQSIAKKQDGVPVLDDKPTKTPSPPPSELSPRDKIAAPSNLFPKPDQANPLVPKIEHRPAKPSQNKLVSTYVVKSGDTVYSIAKKYRLVTARLLEINGIKDPKQLKVGQVLKFM